jgi:LacI family transcriptional regulator
MRASIRDVAMRAGVSAMTVSNVLRHRDSRTSVETRHRVMQVLQELNYIPVRTAAQNRHIETHVLGIVFLQQLQGFVGQRTFQGMTERAQECDRDLLIVLRSQPKWMSPDTAGHFLDRRCDGYIFVGSFRPDLSALLVKHEIPVVECYSVSPPAGAARVVGDDAGAMRQAVDMLSGLGHTRIAHLGGPPNDGEAEMRCAGFREAMQNRGHDTWSDRIFRSKTWAFADRGRGFSEEASQAVHETLAAKPTAVICANDFLALDVWHLAEAQGLRVPEDLSITGMDDTTEGAENGLTTLAVAFEQVGRDSVEALLELVKGEEAQSVSRQVSAILKQRRSVSHALKL